MYVLFGLIILSVSAAVYYGKKVYRIHAEQQEQLKKKELEEAKPQTDN